MHFLMLRLSRSRGAQVTRRTRPTTRPWLRWRGQEHLCDTQREGVLAHSVSLSLHKSARCLRPVLRRLARSTTSYGAFLVLRSEGRLLERDGPRTARHSISGTDPID